MMCRQDLSSAEFADLSVLYSTTSDLIEAPIPRVKLGRLFNATRLSADRRSKAKTIVKKGEGDRGDQRSD
jgi:hypothetical protein